MRAQRDVNWPTFQGRLLICAPLVQEDLCLMAPDAEGVLRFVSGAVLFPQRWSLLEKLGTLRPPLLVSTVCTVSIE